MFAGLSALHYAVDGGHVDIVSMLLLTGQCPRPTANGTSSPQLESPAGSQGCDTSTEASINGDPAASGSGPSRVLVVGCSTISRGGADGMGLSAFTALHLAARRGHAHLLPQLLRCGLDSRAVDGRGRTVLHHAALGAGEISSSTAPLPAMMAVARGAGGSQPLEEGDEAAAAVSADPAGERMKTYSACCVRAHSLVSASC